MIALVDGDIVAYRCAASAEKEELSIALMRTNMMMEDIMLDTEATEFKVYLSGSKENNFRYKVNPEYKANRKDVVKPIHLEACKEFLVTYWKATVCTGMEADDGLGIDQRPDGTIICSIDKDLLQVPGTHYNFVKKEFTKVSEEEGLLSFYLQTLTGDRSDNVIGLQGIGPVKALNMLREVDPKNYYNVCREAYNDDLRFHNNCKLLWVLREPNKTWEPPNANNMEAKQVQEASSGTEDGGTSQIQV